MDRNEVLERLDAAGSDRGPIVYELVHVDLLRAAAELIRAGGWRPIADFNGENRCLTCGSWDDSKWNVSRVALTKPRAIALGYTHYLPEPEPPAREVENE